MRLLLQEQSMALSTKKKLTTSFLIEILRKPSDRMAFLFGINATGQR